MLYVQLGTISTIIHYQTHAVFTKLPEETTNFTEGASSLLTCEMKAPSDSVVYWTKKQAQKGTCQISFQNEHSSSDAAVKLCSTTAVVNKTVEEIDAVYSIFHLELQVRDRAILVSIISTVASFGGLFTLDACLEVW